MKKLVICTAVLGLAFCSAAQAEGCIKGAIVGGVAGSVAGQARQLRGGECRAVNAPQPRVQQQ